MTKNKASFEHELKLYVNQHGTTPCTKLRIDNIVLPKLEGMLGMMLNQSIKTSEQPDGCNYDSKLYQIQFRIIDGQLIHEDKRFENGKRIDSYAMDVSKVEKAIRKGDAYPIGRFSAEGLVNLAKIMVTIPSEEEKHTFANLFCSLGGDCLLITSEEEHRQFIRIDKNNINYFEHIVDEWMETDENGDSFSTQMFIGDALIVTSYPDGHVSGYRVDGKIFAATYSY